MNKSGKWSKSEYMNVAGALRLHQFTFFCLSRPYPRLVLAPALFNFRAVFFCVFFSFMRSLSLTSSLSSSSLSPNFLASLSTLVYFCPSSHSPSLDADPTKLRFEVGDKVRLLGKAVGTGPNAGQKKKTYLLGIVVDRCVEVNII